MSESISYKKFLIGLNEANIKSMEKAEAEKYLLSCLKLVFKEKDNSFENKQNLTSVLRFISQFNLNYPEKFRELLSSYFKSSSIIKDSDLEDIFKALQPKDPVSVTEPISTQPKDPVSVTKEISIPKRGLANYDKFKSDIEKKVFYLKLIFVLFLAADSIKINQSLLVLFRSIRLELGELREGVNMYRRVIETYILKAKEKADSVKNGKEVVYVGYNPMNMFVSFVGKPQLIFEFFKNTFGFTPEGFNKASSMFGGDYTVFISDTVQHMLSQSATINRREYNTPIFKTLEKLKVLIAYLDQEIPLCSTDISKFRTDLQKAFHYYVELLDIVTAWAERIDIIKGYDAHKHLSTLKKYLKKIKQVGNELGVVNVEEEWVKILNISEPDSTSSGVQKNTFGELIDDLIVEIDHKLELFNPKVDNNPTTIYDMLSSFNNLNRFLKDADFRNNLNTQKLIPVLDGEENMTLPSESLNDELIALVEDKETKQKVKTQVINSLRLIRSKIQEEPNISPEEFQNLIVDQVTIFLKKEAEQKIGECLIEMPSEISLHRQYEDVQSVIFMADLSKSYKLQIKLMTMSFVFLSILVRSAFSLIKEMTVLHQNQADNLAEASPILTILKQIINKAKSGNHHTGASDAVTTLSLFLTENDYNNTIRNQIDVNAPFTVENFINVPDDYSIESLPDPRLVAVYDMLIISLWDYGNYEGKNFTSQDIKQILRTMKEFYKILNEYSNNVDMQGNMEANVLFLINLNSFCDWFKGELSKKLSMIEESEIFNLLQDFILTDFESAEAIESITEKIEALPPYARLPELFSLPKTIKGDSRVDNNAGTNPDSDKLIKIVHKSSLQVSTQVLVENMLQDIYARVAALVGSALKSKM